MEPQANDPGSRPQASFPVSPCRYCQQPVIWTYTEKGGRMPVDETPRKEGTFVLEFRYGFEGIYAVYWGSNGHALRWVSHFATCPKADVARSEAKARRAAKHLASRGRYGRSRS